MGFLACQQGRGGGGWGPAGSPWWVLGAGVGVPRGTPRSPGGRVGVPRGIPEAPGGRVGVLGVSRELLQPRSLGPLLRPQRLVLRPQPLQLQLQLLVLAVPDTRTRVRDGQMDTGSGDRQMGEGRRDGQKDKCQGSGGQGWVEGWTHGWGGRDGRVDGQGAMDRQTWGQGMDRLMDTRSQGG